MESMRIHKFNEVIVVTQTTELNPITNLDRLISYLQAIKFSGSVVFDLLYTNGLAYNRFVEINFDGTAFDRQSLNIIEHIDYNLKNEQDNFFRSAPDILVGTVLSEAEIVEILS